MGMTPKENYLAALRHEAYEFIPSPVNDCVMERLTEQMKRAQGITEQLKAENALEWVQRMNNIRACAREIVNTELIYK